MIKHWKKGVSLLLALLMCISILPFTALAEGESTEESAAVGTAQEDPLPVQEEPTGEEPAEEPEQPPVVPTEPAATGQEEPTTEPGQPPVVPTEPPTAEQEEPPTDPEQPDEVLAEAQEDPSETQEEDDGSAQKGIEVREGVFQGREPGHHMPMGVSFEDYPVVESFEIVENGQTLESGDTVTFRAKLTDSNGIDDAYLNFGNNYQSGSKYVSLSYNNDSELWEGSYTFSNNNTPGEYFATSFYVSDIYGFYTSYSSNGRRVMQRLLPGYVYLTGEDPAVLPGDGPENFIFEQKGQTLSPGNVLNVSFDLMPGLDISSISLYFSGPSSFEMDYDAGDFSYNSTTGHVEGTYTLTEDMVNGFYYISYGYFSERLSDEWVDTDWDFDYRSQGFTLTGASEAHACTIKNFKCLENGGTLIDGQTVHFTFNVEGAVPSSVDVRLVLFEAFDSSYGGGVDQGTDVYKTIDAVLDDENTGRYTAEYTFGETDVYGVYQVREVTAYVDGNWVNYHDMDVMFCFAENANTGFARLNKATNLNWTSDGRARFTMPSNHQGKVEVEFYSAAGDWITGCTYSSLDNAAWTASEGVDDFRESEELADGKYYFTVTVLGDGITYFDSETAKSGFLSYTAPSAQLGIATDLTWTDDGYGSFKLPANSHLGSFEYAWYYSHTENSTPVSCGHYGRGWPEQGYGYAYIFDEVLQEFGTGYYYYKVRLLTDNIFSCRNGEWSELSPAYNVTAVAETVIDQINSIDPSTMSSAEITEQLEAIGTDALVQAMLTDEDVVDAIRRLENASGSQTQVSVHKDELVGTTAVGGGLNNAGGGATLVVGAAEHDDLLPAEYDNSVAVRFSMNLNGVDNSENLLVPVLVDLPIPSNINPSFLVLLHYHYAGGAPERIHPYVYQAGGRWYAQFVLTSFSDFILTQTRQFVPVTYLLLKVGEDADVELFENSDDISDYTWYATDEDGQLLEGGDTDVISVVDGKVYAKNPGVAYAVVEIEREKNGASKTETLRCRIDVVPVVDEETGDPIEDPVSFAVKQMTLVDKAATVELYSSNYAKVRILPEMEMLNNRKPSSMAIKEQEEIPVPTDNGVAIESAEFTGAGANLFSAVVLDDRTIAVVPEYRTLELAQAKSSNIGKSYSFGLVLHMADGTEYTAKTATGANAVLKLTIKQTRPSLKVGKLDFNSAIPDDTHSLVFTSRYAVTAIEPDYEAAYKAKKDAVPEWLDVDTYSASLNSGITQGLKASGNLYLLATLDGWAIKVPVKVSYTVKPTYPTFTFSPKTVTLNASAGERAYVSAILKPAAFSNIYDVDDISVTVTEKGRISTGISVSMYQESGNRYGLNVVTNGSDGKAHTYKVSLTLCGKTSSFTVKTIATEAKLSVKSSGTIESLDNSGWIVLQAKISNFHVGTGESYSIVIEKQLEDGGRTQVPINVIEYDEDPENPVENPMFTVYAYGPTMYIHQTIDMELERGSYYAVIKAKLPDGRETNQITVKLNIKWSTPKPGKFTLTSAKGTVDPVRDGSAVTYFFKSGKSYYFFNDSHEYEIIRKIGKRSTVWTKDNDESPFEVYSSFRNNEIPCVAIKLKDGRVPEPGAVYYFRISTPWGATAYTNQVKIPVKMAAVKMKLVSAVTLYLKDQYSNGEMMLEPTDRSVNHISRIVLDKNTRNLFKVYEIGNGKWAIGYKDNIVPAGLKANTSKTVKLSIWFEGNETTKANVIVSVKVNLK